MSGARLVAVEGPLASRIFPLGPDERVLGRAPDSHVVLLDPSASRRHCSIAQRPDGSFWIRDLESYNGTFVNGLPIAQRMLEDGDEIRICRSRFAFQTGASSAFESEVHLNDSAIDGATVVHLARDNSIYLRPEQALAAPPDAARIARGFRSLLRIGAALHAAQGLRDLSERILAAVFEAIPAGRGAVVLPAHGAFGWSRGSGPLPDVSLSRPLLERTQREGVALLSREAGETGSVIAVPLATPRQPVGVLYLEAADPRVRFDEDHLQLATAIGFLASGALADAVELERLRTENQQLKSETGGDFEMVGDSAASRQLYQLIGRIAASGATVLISGETGTGKELVARALHRGSERARGPFVPVNCAAIPENLLESELFGHEKGAFTGALAQRKGKFEIAQGGTLFLDEIGELALPLQAKLLRVLQEREFERVGGSHVLTTDARVIAATNRELPDLIRKGAFREDLYYRLNVVSIRVPPLRDRRDDIAPLARHFLARSSRRCPGGARALSPEALGCLERYSWPGNIRELANAIERAVVLAASETILPEDLPETILDETPAGPAGGLQPAVRDQKRRLVLAALEASGGSFTEAARCLGIHPNSLHRLVRNLGLRESL